MQSWSAPFVPRLPLAGSGAPLALYDSTRQAVHITGAQPEPGRRSMYVCGVTPYDATHMGHAATMIAFDLVNRVWRDAGLDVLYVQNVTDIDDPLLERAQRDGEDWLVLAMRETALFREDMEALRIVPPTHYVGAVESIPAIVVRVVELLRRGAAYRVADDTGDVYFDLASAPRFGQDAHLDRATMIELAGQRGGDPDRPGKRDPLDPLLWRTARDGEPSWDGAELGPGRPGWHIECAVIALDRFGWTRDRGVRDAAERDAAERDAAERDGAERDGAVLDHAVVDVQGGGNDLLFPHHACSTAHAEVLTGVAPFARHGVHTGMIGLHGEKMSKSKGNLVFVSRLRGDGVDPMAMRLALLAGHYRTDRQWTDPLLAAGQQRLARWRSAVARSHGPSGSAVLAALRQALSDDLDTPTALDIIDTWCAAALAGSGDDAQAPDLVRASVDALLGIRL